ncbi:L-seryl-tRNA(Sec) selenium transferase [Desulfovibrio sp. OttesenSCG-928-G11]|nr:L-seryl-tRNA(Sec) selenium transferase [Desulfovibrio sp. OttesenSCG-928-G11]
MPDASVLFRALPAMNALLEALDGEDCPEGALLHASLPRPFLRECVESYLNACRLAIREGRILSAEELALPALMPGLLRHVRRISQPHLRRVINAAGVIVHTNLGRSLLAPEAVKAVAQAATHYSNLEFDLDSGYRGSRYSHVEPLLCRLCGAEAALVVNNNAAAVLLLLDTLCRGREVIVSRGELVEIGGSFRIPEVMEKSGCLLREVGSTNRTHLGDYSRAINENSAALMKVHSSNFRIIGFHAEVARADLAALAKERGLPCIEDLGSGVLFDFAAAGLPVAAGEPVVSRVLAAGMDLVCFSGDKILGGPQAGIIAGKAEYVNLIKKNPLNRALRIDKLTLAALEATLRLYLDPRLAMKRIPTLAMLGMTEKELRPKARKLLRLIRRAVPENLLSLTLTRGLSRAGGGALPEMDLPGPLLRMQSPALSPDALRKALLKADIPVLARVENDALCLDPRTMADDEYGLTAEAFKKIFISLGAN